MSKKDKKMGANKASILKASLPAHLANRIVNIKVKKPKKKDWLTFTYVPDPERPVQFVGPRALVEAQALVEPTKRHMEVQEDKGDLAEFEKMPDGTFFVSIEGQSDDRFQCVSLTPEQFAAFKQWVMEN